MTTPDVPHETRPTDMYALEGVLRQLDRAAQLLPHDEVAAATELIVQAGVQLSDVAEGAGSAALAEVTLIISEAARTAGHAGQCLDTSGQALTEYVFEIGGNTTLDSAPVHGVLAGPPTVTGMETAPVAEDGPDELGERVTVPPAIIQAGDIAQHYLEPLAGQPGKAAYTAALQTCPDDVLCELLRRDMPGVADILLRRYRSYVQKQARKLLVADHNYKNILDQDDLVDEALISFVNACKKFTGGNALLTFTSKHIRGSMIRTLHTQGYTVSVPVGLQGTVLMKIVQDNSHRLAQGEPMLTDQQIAEKFDIPLDNANRGAYHGNALTVTDIRRAMQLTYYMESLDRLFGAAFSDEYLHTMGITVAYADADLADLTGGERPQLPEEHIIEAERLQQMSELHTCMDEALHTLTPKQQVALRGLYGIGEPAKTAREVASTLGCTYQNVYSLAKYGLRALADKHSYLFDYLRP